MLAFLPLDSASNLLTWSNRIYVFGAILTVASAAMVLYEKRSKNQGRELKWGLATEITVIIAAFISLCGTVAAVSFGNVVSKIKDADLAAYEKQADLKIAQANNGSDVAKAIAASANATAATANQKAAEASTKAENSQSSLQQEQAKRAAIEEKMRPRSLSQTQQATIASRMNAFRQRIDFVWYPNDTEILPLAQSIATSLPGWDIHPFQPMQGGTMRGIEIEFDPHNPTAASAASALAKVLRGCSLQTSDPAGDLPSLSQLSAFTGRLNDRPDAPLRITIGHK